MTNLWLYPCCGSITAHYAGFCYACQPRGKDAIHIKLEEKKSIFTTGGQPYCTPCLKKNLMTLLRVKEGHYKVGETRVPFYQWVCHRQKHHQKEQPKVYCHDMRAEYVALPADFQKWGLISDIPPTPYEEAMVHIMEDDFI